MINAMPMTAARWRDCAKPEEMLWHVGAKQNDRVLRLFACACCRIVWPLIPTVTGRNAVVVSERFAEGQATAEELQAASQKARTAQSSGAWLAQWAAAEAAGTDAWQAAQWASAWSAEAAAEAAAGSAALGSARLSLHDLCAMTWHQTRKMQCDVLRDLFGNPFRSARFPTYALLWKSGRIVREAQAIYDSRHLQDLPALAKLLEEAGCDDAEILSHCRGGDGHVRGCWVLDGLLGHRGRAAEQTPPGQTPPGPWQRPRFSFRFAQTKR